MPHYLPLSILQNYKHRIFNSLKILLKAHTKFILGFEKSIQQVERERSAHVNTECWSPTRVWPDGVRALLS